MLTAMSDQAMAAIGIYPPMSAVLEQACIGVRRSVMTRLHSLSICQSGRWTAQGKMIEPLYKCPLDRTTGDGSWATHGCLGQYSSEPQCANIWWNNGGKSYSRSCIRVQ